MFTLVRLEAIRRGLSVTTIYFRLVCMVKPGVKQKKNSNTLTPLANLSIPMG